MEIFISYNMVSMEKGMSIAKTKHDLLLKAQAQEGLLAAHIPKAAHCHGESLNIGTQSLKIVLTSRFKYF